MRGRERERGYTRRTREKRKKRRLGGRIVRILFWCPRCLSRLFRAEADPFFCLAAREREREREKTRSDGQCRLVNLYLEIQKEAFVTYGG